MPKLNQGGGSGQVPGKGLVPDAPPFNKQAHDREHFPTTVSGATGLGWRAGKLYGPSFMFGFATIFGPNDTIAIAQPFIVNQPQDFSAIHIHVTTLQVGATVNCGIYNDDGTGFPGTLVYSGSTLSLSSTGDKVAGLGGHAELAKGLYWIAYKFKSVTTLVVKGCGLIDYIPGVNFIGGDAADIGNAANVGFRQNVMASTDNLSATWAGARTDDFWNNAQTTVVLVSLEATTNVAPVI